MVERQEEPGKAGSVDVGEVSIEAIHLRVVNSVVVEQELEKEDGELRRRVEELTEKGKHVFYHGIFHQRINLIVASSALAGMAAFGLYKIVEHRMGGSGRSFRLEEAFPKRVLSRDRLKFRKK
jgi:hypothetical protein